MEDSLGLNGDLVMERIFGIKSRGWFDSFLFWPKQTIFRVIAAQKQLYQIGQLHLTRASIKIIEDEKEVFAEDIPWDMPAGKSTLLKQVDLHLKNTDFKYPIWQRLMKEFCISYPEFKPLNKNDLAHYC